MQARYINDHQITASSFFNKSNSYYPWQARLGNPYNLHWATESRNPNDDWIKVDLLKVTTMTGIKTQGGWSSYFGAEWVKYLQIQYGESGRDMAYIMNVWGRKVRYLSYYITIIIYEEPLLFDISSFKHQASN